MNLKNEYHIIDSSDIGFPCVEVHGDTFCNEDLYELIGQHGFMATINLKAGSISELEYGESITGVILYTPNETKSSVTEKLKIRCFSLDGLPLKTVAELKYGGLNIPDIQSVSFIPIIKDKVLHETGEKKVPNIIHIDIGGEGSKKIDVNRLQQSLLVKKNNTGVRLAGFEKEDLVGLTLALNKGRIDSGILQHLGFNKETMLSNINILNSYYTAKERLGALSDVEAQKRSEIEEIIRIKRLTKVIKEIGKSGVKDEELIANSDALKEFIQAVNAFRPHILLYGKMQVYWDVESYIHIAMRHFQRYQLGSFKLKTPFSYKAEDLETLIEQVLKVIEEEYESHSIEKPTSDFRREGKMAVEFNGDYYTVQITPDGRLVRFHAW